MNSWMMGRRMMRYFLPALILIFDLFYQALPPRDRLPAAAHAQPPAQKSWLIHLPVVIAHHPFTGDTFTFLSWADTKGGITTLASLSRQARPLNPKFSVFIGDLEPDGFSTSGAHSWTKALNGNANNGLGDITLTLRGNHDTHNTSGWQAYFNTQAVAEQAGAARFTALDNNLTYAFDYGNSYFIGIDVPGNVEQISMAQIAFIDSGLAGAEARGLTHAFIFFHGPIYPVSSHSPCHARVCPTPDSVINLIKVLNKHPIVAAVFNGHEHLHAYVHLDRSRVPEITHPFEQFVTGAAGADLYPCDNRSRFDMCGSYQGFAIINVNKRTFTVRIYQQGSDTPVETYTFTRP